MSKFLGTMKYFFRVCWRRMEGAIEAHGTGRAYLVTYGAVSLPDSFRKPR